MSKPRFTPFSGLAWAVMHAKDHPALDYAQNHPVVKALSEQVLQAERELNALPLLYEALEKLLAVASDQLEGPDLEDPECYAARRALRAARGEE